MEDTKINLNSQLHTTDKIRETWLKSPVSVQASRDKLKGLQDRRRLADEERDVGWWGKKSVDLYKGAV